LLETTEITATLNQSKNKIRGRRFTTSNITMGKEERRIFVSNTRMV